MTAVFQSVNQSVSQFIDTWQREGWTTQSQKNTE